MANLVVVSSGVLVTVSPGIYSDSMNSVGDRYFKQSNISGVYADSSGDSVVVQMTSGKDWYLQIPGYTGTDAMIVDLVDTVAPTTLADLALKIAALII